jgi:glycerol-3-phosphate dehydrogenase
MVYYQHSDGRVCIVFPFQDKVLMGSTDIPVADPDQAECSEDEIGYMLETLRGIFPGIPVARAQIVFTFCGVRPLPASHSQITANISRGHTIHKMDPDGGRAFPVYSLIGGKWTTFRALAEQTADELLSQLGLPRRCSTDQVPIGGGRGYPVGERERAAWIGRVAQQSGVKEARVEVLLQRYGTIAEPYLKAAGIAGEQPLRRLPGYSVGEIRHMAVAEWVVHLADIVYRRSTIGLLGYATRPVLAELAEVVGNVLDWDPGRQESEIAQALWKPLS